MPLLTFRKRLLSIRAKQLEKANFLIQFEEVECKISQQLVTFRSVQLRPTIGSFSQKIDNFLRQIAMSPVTCANLRNLISLLNQALKSSELAEFSPILLPFGSLVTGLATFNSDLDLLIKFEALPVDAIDYETSLIALEVIRPIFNDKLGLSTSEKCIYSSGRCPIVALKFDQCIPNCVSSSGNLHFNRCDISFHQLYSYYNSKLLEFLVSYDRRFYEMSMLIKYWAKRAGLIGKETLSTYGLYMMIVFIMQQTSPPILPTIERLQKLAQLQSDYVPIKVDKYNFAFCDNPAIIGRSHCPMTTEELVVKFINYYQSFNYRNQAICPRLGKLIDKNTIYTRNSAENLGDTNSIFKQTFIVIEDPFVTDNNCGGIFHRTPMSIWQEAFDDAASRIRREPNNILEILTNPKVIFNSH
ncbi:hypothetical protein TYRP_017763 [Tyrophagus putrescentiae]|nr:hypothetical protein TYRP_017763 [Tyrophagus putrescentiae]